MASVVTSMWAMMSCNRMVLQRSVKSSAAPSHTSWIFVAATIFSYQSIWLFRVTTTTSQAKNSETGMFLATIDANKNFLSTLLNLLIVGHTHEDIHQIFSVLLSLVVRRHRFHTLDELALEIQTAMRKVFVDRLEVVSVVLIGEVFDFGAWLDAQGVHLHNAWVSRDGVDAPHSFCYKMREDLTDGELENVPPSALSTSTTP
jgi:hypothetical protein